MAFVSLREDGYRYPITIKLSDINLNNPAGYYQYVRDYMNFTNVFKFVYIKLNFFGF